MNLAIRLEPWLKRYGKYFMLIKKYNKKRE